MKFKILVSGLVAAFALSGFASAALLVGYNGDSLTIADSSNGDTWASTGATSTFTVGGENRPPVSYNLGSSSVHNTYGLGGPDLGGATPDSHTNPTNYGFWYDGPGPGSFSSPAMALQWTITNGQTNSLVLDNLYYDIGRNANGGIVLRVEKYDSSDVLVGTIIPGVIPNDIYNHSGAEIWSQHARALDSVSLGASEKLIITWFVTNSDDYIFDNLALSGSFTSLIPEPGSAFALAGLLGSGLLLRNRRRAA